MEQASAVFGAAAAVVAAFVWAVASTAYSRAAIENPPFVVNATRIVVGTVILSVVCTVRPDGWGAVTSIEAHHIWWMVVAALASFGFGDVLFLKAAHRIGVTTALSIGSCYPVLSTAVGILWFKQPLSISLACGIGAVMLGICVVLRTSHSGGRETMPSNPSIAGIAYAVGATACWAVLTVATQQAALLLEPVVATLVKTALGLVVCIPIGYLMERSIRYPFLRGNDLRSLLPILGFEMGVGAFCYTYAYQHAPLAVAATLASTHPLFALLLAVRAKRERLSWAKLLGISVVILGISLVVSGS